MHDMPFVNPALGVEAIGFRRHDGDWLGVMITPWFLNLFLIYGGGELWGDIPAGERRYLNLPCGTLQFLADDDPDLGPYQYCPLDCAGQRPAGHGDSASGCARGAGDGIRAAAGNAGRSVDGVTWHGR